MNTHYDNCNLVPRIIGSLPWANYQESGEGRIVNAKKLKLLTTDLLCTDAKTKVDVAFAHALETNTLRFATFQPQNLMNSSNCYEVPGSLRPPKWLVDNY